MKVLCNFSRELINKLQTILFKLHFNFFLYPNSIITYNMDETCVESMSKCGIKYEIGVYIVKCGAYLSIP